MKDCIQNGSKSSFQFISQILSLIHIKQLQLTLKHHSSCANLQPSVSSVIMLAGGHSRALKTRGFTLVGWRLAPGVPAASLGGAAFEIVNEGQEVASLEIITSLSQPQTKHRGNEGETDFIRYPLISFLTIYTVYTHTHTHLK